MIYSVVQLVCATSALALVPSFAVVADSAFDPATLDSPLSQPIFGSPVAISEAERSLAPQIQRAPLNDAMDSTLSRRDHFRIRHAAPPSHTTWERRAFVTAALVALACALLGVLAALVTIARSR